MKVRILKAFPYLTPHNHELVRLQEGECIDVDSSHERFIDGWVKEGLAELVDVRLHTEQLPELIEVPEVEGNAPEANERKAKARKPKAGK